MAVLHGVGQVAVLPRQDQEIVLILLVIEKILKLVGRDFAVWPDYDQNTRTAEFELVKLRKNADFLVGAPACGDVMKLQIQVSDSGIIEKAVFKTYGCGSAIASSSLLTEWVKGKTLDQAAKIKNSQILKKKLFSSDPP